MGKRFIGSIIFVSFVVVLFITLGSQPEETTGSKDSSDKSVQELEWEDYSNWDSQGELITLNQNDPFLLWSNDSRQRAIYKKGDQLQYSDVKTKKELIHLEEDPRIRIWKNENSFLIGVEGKEQHSSYSWYEILLREGKDPKETKVTSIPFRPSKILTMKMVREPTIFVVTAERNEYFQELSYLAGSGEFRPLNLIFDEPQNQDIKNAYSKRKPKKVVEPKVFDSVKQFDGKDENPIYVFKDERGTIVYYGDNEGYSISRYVGIDVIDGKVFQNPEGKSYPLVRIRNQKGERLMSFLNTNPHEYFKDQPQLLEPSWNMFYKEGFYKQTDNRLHLLAYSQQENSWKAPVINKTLPLDGAEFIESDGANLIYNHNGEERLISLYDIMNTVMKEEKIASYWIDPNSQTSIKFPDRENSRIFIEAPSSFDKKVKQNIPDHLDQALNKECFTGCGDYRAEIVVKEFDGVWHVLNGKKLYRLKGGLLQGIGEIPIQLSHSFSFSSAATGFTAKDFTRWQGNWFILDTYGNQILKLNDSLEIVKKVKTPSPSSLRKSNGSLQVDSLEDILTLDQNLDLISSQSKLYEQLDETKQVKIPDNHYFEGDLTWLYSRVTQKLYQLEPSNNTWRSFFVGKVQANNADFKFIPYKNQVVSLFDHKLLLFNEKGNWLKTLSFPRDEVEVDGGVVGEGHYQLDEDKGILYVIQGYRVLAIDLEKDQVRTVFYQKRAELQGLAFQDNKLYLSLNSNQYNVSNSIHELVTYNPDTDKVTRSRWKEGNAE